MLHELYGYLPSKAIYKCFNVVDFLTLLRVYGLRVNLTGDSVEESL